MAGIITFLVVSVDSDEPEASRFWGTVEGILHAGTGRILEDLTPDEWRGVVDTNLTGMFLCLQAAFRTMKAQLPRGGRIINNGSISATTPRPNSIAYTATKHAV
jgi:NAD(P)-dependent dehydrogenase (short-subunit alcohol dehydrogenase family)